MGCPGSQAFGLGLNYTTNFPEVSSLQRAVVANPYNQAITQSISVCECAFSRTLKQIQTRAESDLFLPAITFLCIGHPPSTASLTPTWPSWLLFLPLTPLRANPALTDLSLLVPSSKPSLRVLCMRRPKLSAVSADTHDASVPDHRQFQYNTEVTRTRGLCRCPGSTKEGLEMGREGAAGQGHLLAGSDRQRCLKQECAGQGGEVQQGPCGRDTWRGARIP